MLSQHANSQTTYIVNVDFIELGRMTVDWQDIHIPVRNMAASIVQLARVIDQAALTTRSSKLLLLSIGRLFEQTSNSMLSQLLDHCRGPTLQTERERVQFNSRCLIKISIQKPENLNYLIILAFMSVDRMSDTDDGRRDWILDPLIVFGCIATGCAGISDWAC